MRDVTGPPMLAGALTGFALTDALQLLDLGARTGVLEVEGDPSGGGAIRVQRGSVLDVVVMGRVPEPEEILDRLVTLLELPAGRWAFYSDDAPAVVRSELVGVRISALLLDATAQLDDRAAHHRRTGNDPASPNHVPAAYPGGPSRLTGAELAILAAIDGFRDTREIAARVRCSDAEVRVAIALLERIGLVGSGDVAGWS